MRVQNNKGSVRDILLIVFIVIVLGYFGINIKEILDREGVKNNFTYIWGLAGSLWENWVLPVLKLGLNFVFSLLGKQI